MKTEFKREMNRNYMVLHPEEEIGGVYVDGKQDQGTSAVSGKADRWGDISIF